MNTLWRRLLAAGLTFKVDNQHASDKRLDPRVKNVRSVRCQTPTCNVKHGWLGSNQHGRQAPPAPHQGADVIQLTMVERRPIPEAHGALRHARPLCCVNGQRVS